MVDWEDAADYIGTGAEERAKVERCLEVATTLLDESLEGAWRDMPEAVYDQCLLDITFTVFKRSDSPNGVAVYTTGDGIQPVRQPNDPLSQVRPILNRYVTQF